MKLRLLSFSALLIFAGLVFSSTSSGRADGANQGNTGAPGDNSRTCGNCHNGGNFGVQTTIKLINDAGMEVTAYKPGETYTVQVSVDKTNGTEPRGWGFQMICINAPEGENGDDIKTWVDNNTNYKISDISNGRTYAEHDGVSSMNTFDVEWTAPEANTGVVTFYAAANGVNFNGRTSGDAASNDVLEIMEDFSSSTANTWTEELTTFPNPTTDRLSLNLPTDFTGGIQLVNLLGQRLKSWNLNEGRSLEVDLSDLSNGIYLIDLRHADGSSKTVQVVKK